MRDPKQHANEADAISRPLGSMVDARDPFGTLSRSRWTNRASPSIPSDVAAPQAISPAPPERARTRPRFSAALARVAAVSAVRATASAVKTAGRMAPIVSRRLRRIVLLFRRRKPVIYVRDDGKHRVLINRFSGLAALTEMEQSAIGHITSEERRIHQASTELATEGEISPAPMFIVSGWAARIRRWRGGRQQVIGFLLPGDGIAIRGCSEPRSTASIVAQTTLETVDGGKLLRMAQDERFPGIGHAIGRIAVQDEEFLVNQIQRLSGMPPAERLAHLAMELRWRLAEAGIADDRTFDLPIDRDMLANALAVSPRRLSRAFRELRREKLLRIKYSSVRILNAARLSELSAFSPPQACSCGVIACNGQHAAIDGAQGRAILDAGC